MSGRICIKCSQALIRQRVEGVEVDCCEGCGGLWLDKGEIWKLSASSAEDLDALSRQLGATAPKSGAGAPYGEYEVLTPPNASPLDTPCPACEGKLALARLGPVQVEHCTECEGIYLDRGELDKAITVMKDKGNPLTTIAALARSVSTRGTIG